MNDDCEAFMIRLRALSVRILRAHDQGHHGQVHVTMDDYEDVISALAIIRLMTSPGLGRGRHIREG